MLWLIVFILTLIESVIATEIARYERLSGRPRGKMKHSAYAALWSGAFEIILLIGTFYVVKEDLWLMIPAALGAVLGTFGTLERRRLKLVRQRVKFENAKRNKNDQLPSGASVPVTPS